jgi:hypothetical protein
MNRIVLVVLAAILSAMMAAVSSASARGHRGGHYFRGTRTHYGHYSNRRGGPPAGRCSRPRCVVGGPGGSGGGGGGTPSPVRPCAANQQLINGFCVRPKPNLQ